MSAPRTTPRLGLGIGMRPELEGLIACDELGFLEVVAENVDARRLPDVLLRARERGMEVIPHGIRLSLGGGERPDHRTLDHLAILADQLDSPLVSEHIAFVRADGVEAGHVMPVPRTRESLEIITENVLLAQERLPVPLALEHVAAMVEWPAAEMDEAAFVGELLDRTGALLLLDLSNLYANAYNHGYDAVRALGRFPLQRIAYVHVGGGEHRADGMYHDTHAHPVVPGVLALVEELFALTDAPGLLLERDSDFPTDTRSPEAEQGTGHELLRELLAIDAAAKRGRARRDAGAR
ncbi:MAG: uncharacterized protein QOJ89_2927 [bacterium]